MIYFFMITFFTLSSGFLKLQAQKKLMLTHITVTVSHLNKLSFMTNSKTINSLAIYPSYRLVQVKDSAYHESIRRICAIA